ncbi:MAG: DUF2188 domain-containing protein [Planctomycetota bacterium]
MANNKNYHAVPHPDGWAVKKEGSQRATSIHQTQQQAWDATRGHAKVSHGEAFLHSRKGQIRERNTYGPDPHPPKG